VNNQIFFFFLLFFLFVSLLFPLFFAYDSLSLAARRELPEPFLIYSFYLLLKVVEVF